MILKKLKKLKIQIKVTTISRIHAASLISGTATLTCKNFEDPLIIDIPSAVLESPPPRLESMPIFKDNVIEDIKDSIVDGWVITDESIKQKIVSSIEKAIKDMSKMKALREVIIYTYKKEYDITE